MLTNKIIIPFFFILNYLFFPSIINGQEIKSPNQRISISLSYGNQKWLNVDYDYKVTVIGFQYFNTISSNNSLSFSAFVHPKFGITKYMTESTSTSWEKGNEYGLGVGGRLDIKFWDQGLSGFVSLQSGPHYITGSPDRQKPGLLISSGIFSGLSYRIQDTTNIELIFGFRHLSITEVVYPNGGLNNLIMGVGITFEV